MGPKTFDLKDNPLISPSGEEFTEITNLSEFCREHNAGYVGVLRVINEIQLKSIEGWHLLKPRARRSVDQELFKVRKIFDLSEDPLVSPTGVEYLEIRGLVVFAEEHGLDRCGLSDLLRGRFKHHRGWHLKSTTTPYEPNDNLRSDGPKPKKKDLSSNPLVSPDGTEYKVIYGLQQFCIDHDLVLQPMCDLIQGKIVLNHRGWHLKERPADFKCRKNNKKPIRIRVKKIKLNPWSR